MSKQYRLERELILRAASHEQAMEALTEVKRIETAARNSLTPPMFED